MNTYNAFTSVLEMTRPLYASLLRSYEINQVFFIVKLNKIYSFIHFISLSILCLELVDIVSWVLFYHILNK